MTYFPRVRPALHLAQWCGVGIAAVLAVAVGASGGLACAAIGACAVTVKLTALLLAFCVAVGLAWAAVLIVLTVVGL
ncbi:hypothetical protein [Gemmatimonas sp.]|uniref:hypothetical protein n=1 Tax=Gemmatimonas sp. TaxID=1962908 RepID=UPI0033429E35